MSNEHVGMYIRLLCLQQQKGRLSEKDMLFICKTHVEDVFLKFDRDADGFYSNKRMAAEVERRQKYSNSRRVNVLHRFSKQKTKDTHVVHMENENENTIETAIEVDVIIKDINIVLGAAYKLNSKKTRDLIKARLKDGFNIEDFKKVHRKMLLAWGNDEKMVKYLRPITLYGSKFESYLNMKEPQTKLTESGMKAFLIGKEWLNKKEAIDAQ